MTQLSNVNVSFKHYSASLCSPMAAVADPWKTVVDRDAWMPIVFSLLLQHLVVNGRAVILATY